MKHKIVLEFDDEETRDHTLGILSNSAEQDIMMCLEMEGINVTFDYKQAFPAWGWNGEGDPTVSVKEVDND